MNGQQKSKTIRGKEDSKKRQRTGNSTEPRTESRDPRHARSLLQNAESFFQEAVSYIERGGERDWVFGVVNLTIALELTLKAVLQSEHWALIFENINVASKRLLQTGHFRTVGFQEALHRAQEVCGVGFDAQDLRYLGQLNNFRNQILHFEFDLNIEQVKGLVARGLNIFNHLMTTRLRRGRDMAFQISTQLVEFERYVSERMRRLAPRLAKSRRLPHRFRYCEKCGQDATILRNGLPLCLYCGNEPSPRALALNSEGDEGPCPKCEHGRLALILWNNEEGDLVCVLCGFKSAVGRNRVCDWCGEEFWDDTGDAINMCRNCSESQLERD
jgi:hypothetical protein